MNRRHERPESSARDRPWIEFCLNPEQDGIPEVYDESNPDPRLEDESINIMAPDGKTFPKVNWMKSGFILSDLNITVSPNYAKELVSGPGKGAELDDVIRRSGGIETRRGDSLSV